MNVTMYIVLSKNVSNNISISTPTNINSRHYLWPGWGFSWEDFGAAKWFSGATDGRGGNVFPIQCNGATTRN